MIAIMRDALGVGLAATQLGDPAPPARLPGRARRRARPRSSTRSSSGSPTSSRSPRRAASACRGSSVDVERPLHARVSGLDVDGEPILIEASGLEARVLQHEIDHLDGVLILDRTEREQRKGALRALREGSELQPARRPRTTDARGETRAASDA